jgi:ketol-acid reductoisomerase
MANQSKDCAETSSQGGLGIVAMLGYGPAARLQALRLRRTGFDVRVAVRPGGMSWVRAVEDGFRPVPHADAVKGASIVVFRVPEAETSSVYSASVAPHMQPGTLIVFHNATPVFSKTVEPADHTDVVLVASRGVPNDEHTPTPFALAVHQDSSGTAMARALAYATAAFGTPEKAEPETTFTREATREILELAVERGGLPELLASWEKMLSSGHEPDEAAMAYYQSLLAAVQASAASFPVPPTPSSHARLADPSPEWDALLKVTRRGVA